MPEKSNKHWLITAGLFTCAVILFALLSQMHSAEDQIFITDNYFIQPKSQPFQFILMWFANIAILLFAIWLGRLIALFLWRKGLLITVVGAGLLIGAICMAYFSLFLQTNVNSKSDLVTMGILILFVGGMGALMLLSPFFGKNK